MEKSTTCPVTLPGVLPSSHKCCSGGCGTHERQQCEQCEQRNGPGGERDGERDGRGRCGCDHRRVPRLKSALRRSADGRKIGGSGIRGHVLLPISGHVFT